jgi:hypothetical protein
LKEFKNKLKLEILLNTETFFWDYDHLADVDRSEFNRIDKIIISAAAEVLSFSRVAVFGLLYSCHSMEETLERLKDFEIGVTKSGTITKYKQDAMKDVVKEVSEEKYSKLIKKEIEKVCGSENA